MIFQRFTQNKLKKKDKTVLKTVYNKFREVRWTILKVEGDVLSGFGVQGEKVDFRKSWGGNVDFFLICSLCRSSHVESNKIEFFILWFFVIYYDFSKIQPK